jgi:hypothetical protein
MDDRDVLSETREELERQDQGSAEAEAKAVESEGSDKFDLSSLRLGQDYHEMVEVKRIINVIPVRRPQGQRFFRVHDGDDWYLETRVLEDKVENETYTVKRELWPDLAGELTPKILYAVIDTQNNISVWPIRLPGEDGRIDTWNRSAWGVAEMAKKGWVRMVSNRANGGYDYVKAPPGLPEPTWPDLTFEEILQIAFKDRFIDDPNHPVLRRLRGEL